MKKISWQGAEGKSAYVSSRSVESWDIEAWGYTVDVILTHTQGFWRNGGCDAAVHNYGVGRK